MPGRGVTGDAAAVVVVVVWLVLKHECEPRAAIWVRASYEVDTFHAGAP